MWSDFLMETLRKAFRVFLCSKWPKPECLWERPDLSGDGVDRFTGFGDVSISKRDDYFLRFSGWFHCEKNVD